MTDRAGVRATIFAAAGARSAVIGFTGVALGLYLAQVTSTAAQAGLIIGLGLAGTAVATLVVTAAGDRLGRVRLLVMTSLLAVAGLGAFAATSSLPVLALASFAGMLNGMGRDRGSQQVLDQAILADQFVPEADRTRVFARYTLLQDVMGSPPTVTLVRSRVSMYCATLVPVIVVTATLVRSTVPMWSSL